MICIGLISRVIPPRNDKRTACRASTKGSVKSTKLRRPESGSEILLVRQSFTSTHDSEDQYLDLTKAVNLASYLTQL